MLGDDGRAAAVKAASMLTGAASDIPASVS
jgi:hypothetical protein